MTEMNRENALSVLACFEPPSNEGPPDAAVQQFVEQTGITADEALDVFLTCPLPLRAPPRLDGATDEPDKIGIDGSMVFLRDIEVKLDEIACLAIAEFCKCPTLGEFTRAEFIQAWAAQRISTIMQMKAYAGRLRNKLRTDLSYRRTVYKYTFLISRVQGQRHVQHDIAVDYWRLFFGDPVSKAGNTMTTPWLDLWIEFLEGRGKRPISRDLWGQIELFLIEANKDETFGWWDPEGAWPPTLDEFVAWVKAKREEGKMEE
ncbi:uncharacterized protein N7483_011962 [Penicillium malachiteum]|uniref:uncharacterized protein n=1 Tax=Penicillium malachiteum TaxID=1324776 RepID=UPI00254673F5|nr:uncharacterized protein N7483_011962 [Penicillium malachiteum]KAJ5714781.1 hypothetical protein N7483_011962 [Penicillium malachiteum]